MLILGSCGKDRPEEQGLSVKNKPPAPAAPATELTTCFDGVRLRRSPGPEGPVLIELPAGTPLVDLQEVSSFVTPVVLQGKSLEEPWFKVATPSGQQGWIYGGVFHFCETPAADLLKRKRLQAFFDTAQVRRMVEFRRAFTSVATAKDLSQVYREGLKLRTEIVNRLDDRLARLEGNPIPNLFWLEEDLPGFVLQLVADGTAYHLFVDFRQWEERSKKTAAKGDDAFFGLCFQAFPQDSIEYFFPAWTIQVGENRGHSLLGRGIHRQIIRQMDQVIKESDLFEPEILSMKTEVINDITRPYVTYWESQDQIIAELEAIMTGDHRCLNQRDLVGLEVRLTQFRDPGRHGIELNFKSGAHEL